MPCVRTLDSRDRSPLYIAPLFCPTGYFGCRDNATGGFDGEKFKVAAARPQVKLIEIKLSQGAKPSHGTHPPTNPHARTHARTHTHTHTHRRHSSSSQDLGGDRRSARHTHGQRLQLPPRTQRVHKPQETPRVCAKAARSVRFLILLSVFQRQPRRLTVWASRLGVE